MTINVMLVRKRFRPSTSSLTVLVMALLPAASLAGEGAAAADRDDTPPGALIGYTEFRTDLPGGRHANVKTRRAVVVKADGTGRRVLAEELTRDAGYSTQYVGWSSDGKAARLSRDWKSEEVGKWEEEHKTFRTTGEGVRHDAYLIDLASGKATRQTPVEEKKSALIKNLVHGRSLSPDGKRCAFEDPAYRLYLADADGSNAKQIQTGLRFHLMPSWSPDGTWVLFVAGEHYDCHPHVIKADGTGLKKLASRNGYRGVIDFLDVYDFHDGSSDLPVWAPDSKSVFYTAKVGSNVELFRVTLDGTSEQLTARPAGSMHYHPAASLDGKWLVYGSKRDGVRQLYVMRLRDKKEWRITDMKKGHAAAQAAIADVKQVMLRLQPLRNKEVALQPTQLVPQAAHVGTVADLLNANLAVRDGGDNGRLRLRWMHQLSPQAAFFSAAVAGVRTNRRKP